jgi:hypothetical protein
MNTADPFSLHFDADMNTLTGELESLQKEYEASTTALEESKKTVR